MVLVYNIYGFTLTDPTQIKLLTKLFVMMNKRRIEKGIMESSG